jgi:hypothetical protein
MDLPFDVWLYIASFIPTEELQTLYGVNRIFFNIAMDINYNKVVLRRDAGNSRALPRWK